MARPLRGEEGRHAGQEAGAEHVSHGAPGLVGEGAVKALQLRRQRHGVGGRVGVVQKLLLCVLLERGQQLRGQGAIPPLQLRIDLREAAVQRVVHRLVVWHAAVAPLCILTSNFKYNYTEFLEFNIRIFFIPLWNKMTMEECSMNRFKELRDSFGINQQKLAIDLNVTQATISKYETGLAEPDISMILQYAEYFHVTTDYVLGKSDSKYPVSSKKDFSDEEMGLIWDFRRLNPIQKEKVIIYMKGMLQDGLHGL